ncbi:MAG: hypothetical protein ABIR24_02460 [Verrucomicrobiota bacterium]
MSYNKKTNLPIATRLCASLSLVVWLAAFLFCSNTCCIGESHCETGHEQHGEASHHDHDRSSDSDSHSDHKDSFCNSLKSIVHTASNQTLSKPDFSFVTLDFVSPSHLVTVARREASVFRQGSRRDWVSTPEVYLGPAFRSLAPPVLL